MNFSATSLTYLSAIVWVFPPLRQYRTFFFKYFLILAISDILDLLFLNFFRIKIPSLYIFISFCLLIALQNSEYLKKKKLVLIGLVLLVSCLSFFRIGNNSYLTLIALLHLMVIIRILYLFIIVVAQKQTISFFYLVLTFYEFTVLLKFSNYLFPFNVEAHTYFYITTGFELLVGIFFTLFREESPKLVYKLK